MLANPSSGSCDRCVVPVPIFVARLWQIELSAIQVCVCLGLCASVCVCVATGLYTTVATHRSGDPTRRHRGTSTSRWAVPVPSGGDGNDEGGCEGVDEAGAVELPRRRENPTNDEADDVDDDVDDDEKLHVAEVELVEREDGRALKTKATVGARFEATGAATPSASLGESPRGTRRPFGEQQEAGWSVS